MDTARGTRYRMWEPGRGGDKAGDTSGGGLGTPSDGGPVDIPEGGQWLQEGAKDQDGY